MINLLTMYCNHFNSYSYFNLHLLDYTYRYLETGVDPISMQACMAVI